VNLKINKEIIEGFFNYGNNKDKNEFYLDKLKEENQKLTTQIDKATHEKDELRQRVLITNSACVYRTNIK
jgi:hypothetical protein